MFFFFFQEDENPLRAKLDLLEGRTEDYHPERDGLKTRDFLNFVELVNNQLAKHWMDDKRVPVIKLTIQVAKMLAEPGALFSGFGLPVVLMSLVISYNQLIHIFDEFWAAYQLGNTRGAFFKHPGHDLMNKGSCLARA